MNIYVGNLSVETTEDNLTQAFSAFGKVESVRIIRDRASGQSKGFGFVTIEDEQEAQAAIDEMNGKDLDGQAIKVEKGRGKAETDRDNARPKGFRSQRGGRFQRDNRGGSGRSDRGRGGHSGSRRRY